MAPSQARARIVLITTGGTVASQTTADGAVPTLSADDLMGVAEVPGTVGDDADAVPEPLVSAVDVVAVEHLHQFLLLALKVPLQPKHLRLASLHFPQNGISLHAVDAQLPLVVHHELRRKEPALDGAERLSGGQRLAGRGGHARWR